MPRSDHKLAMRTVLTLVGILIANVLAFGQAPVSTPAECPKNVSFAVTAGGRPVAAIPNFVAHSIGNDKHQDRYPGLCFAQSPDPKAKNYVVVFSTQQESFTGLVPSVLKYVEAAPIAENSSISSVYGEMWHYTSNQPAAANTTTSELLRTETSNTLFVRAYNEQGAIVSQVNLKEVSGWLHTKEKLLDRVLADIRADSGKANASQVSLKTSLPVYYVNCDVPVKSLTNPEPAVASKPAIPPPPVQSATLEFWSSPAGADISLDGSYIGKTPYSAAVPPGEHMVVLQKKDFGSWQRRVVVSTGNRRVGGDLEQKTLALDFSSGPAHPIVARKDSESVLDFVSTPAGADIFLDGGFVGKTPYSMAIEPGEHTVTLRKKDFGTWQRKLTVEAGKRTVGGNLQQGNLQQKDKNKLQ